MADTEDLSGPSNINSPKPIPTDNEQESTPTSGKSFASHMQNESPPSAQSTGSSQNISPSELTSQVPPVGSPPTMETVLEQANSNASLIGDLQNEFHNNKDKLNLRQSQKYLFRNKLTKANEHIRSAAKKAGASPSPPPAWASKKHPIAKFLDLLSDSQVQLHNTQKMITNLRDKHGMIRPTDLLMIQVKLARAQQELEYSSVLLTKAVDDIKQMFNIQI